MRRTKRSDGLFLCLLLNMLLNFEGMIPAAILLVLHFVFGWSLWRAAGALGVWLLWLDLVVRYRLGRAVRQHIRPEKRKQKSLFDRSAKRKTIKLK